MANGGNGTSVLGKESYIAVEPGSNSALFPKSGDSQPTLSYVFRFVSNLQLEVKFPESEIRGSHVRDEACDNRVTCFFLGQILSPS